MGGNGKTERQFGSMADADAPRDQNAPDTHAVVPNLKGRRWVEEIEAVVRRAREAERLTKAAGACRQLACQFVRCPALFARGSERRGWETPIADHLFEASNRLERSEQNGPGLALFLAGDVHAVVQAVDGVNISVSGGAEEYLVAWGGSAMGVCRWVGGIVMRTEVCFELDDAAGKPSRGRAAREDFAKQARGDVLYRRFKERALHQSPG